MIGPRQPHEPELMGVGDIADALGVSQTNVRKMSGWKQLIPYDEVKSTPLYRADDVAEWSLQHGDRSMWASTRTLIAMLG